MPNHVTTELQAPEHVIMSLIRATTNDERGEGGDFDLFTVDFDLIIPEPHYSDPMFTATRHEYPGGMVGYEIDGYSPMDWCRDMWGTKWNAYSVELTEDTEKIRFDTAWASPLPVIKKLSELYPEDEIFVRYADEDLGRNCGEYVMLNGEVTQETELSQEEANDFAAKLKYGETYAEHTAEWDL